MDVVLLPYLQAPDESARAKYLDELLLFHAAPVVAQTLRLKLGFHVSRLGTNPNNHDAEDLYQEIMTKIVQVLHDLRTASSRAEIEDFGRYVVRIASNACIDFLRSKTRVRFLLKHNLQDLLRRHPDLAQWKHEGEIVCGLAVWQDRSRAPASKKQIQQLENDLDSFQASRFPNQNISRIPLSRLVPELLQWINSPIELDTFSNMLAILMGVQNRPDESFDEKANKLIEARLARSTLSGHSEVEARALLSRVWSIVKELPSEQRDTFCLGFEDDDGSDFFSLLLEARVVTLAQLAQALDRSLEELVRLRSQMPMDDAVIAESLNGSRRQVIKWRFRALRRLKAELLT